MPMQYPDLVVDVHTHLFNARYIPLKGVLRSKGVPGFLAGPAKRLFNLLTGKAEFDMIGEQRFELSVAGTDEIGVMADALAGVAAAELAASRGFRAQLAKREDVRLEAAVVARDLEAEELYEVLTEIEGLYLFEQKENSHDYQRTREAEMIVELSALRAASELEGVKSIAKWLFRRFRKALHWLLEKLEESIIGDALGTARDYVKFFLLMLAKETTQLARLLSGYRPEQNVNTLVHHMMDMQKAYADEEPYYAFYKKQIKRMRALVDSSERCLLGFVAFDPRRSDPDGLEMVRYGLGRGNCGVKVYPPMGYTAYPADPVLRERFDRLYDYCCRERIPVLTHCTAKGFEAYHLSGVLSDPDGWAEVLDQVRYRNLILCYGHAGGGGTSKKIEGSDDPVLYPGWYAENDDQWSDDKNFARKVLAHCQRYPNVYCDFSYFFDLMDDNARIARFTERLVAAFESDEGHFAFADKAMYGSDWHMPRMTRHAGEFLDALIEIFDHPALVGHKDKFFAKNALRFLDIDRCRARHEVLQPGRWIPSSCDSVAAEA